MKMHFETFSNYTALSKYASQIIIQAIRDKPSSLVCTATGHSPKLTYEMLADYEKANPGYFRQMKIIQLDEWICLTQTHPSSCAYFIQKHLVKPLNIFPENLFLFNGASINLPEECQRANLFLAEHGPIDICILGIGENGHLGFNEPSDSFTSQTHVISLQSQTQQHQMVKTLETKPTFGITLGIGDILLSKQIILIVTGENKKKVLEKLGEKKVTPKLPVSALWKHTNPTCLVDKETVMANGMMQNKTP